MTLEDKKLENAVEPYLRKLEPVVQGKDDVIGCAVAVNGAIESADVYASHALFVKVWPTLLRGGAVDALASAVGGREDFSDDSVFGAAGRISSFGRGLGGQGVAGGGGIGGFGGIGGGGFPAPMRGPRLRNPPKDEPAKPTKPVTTADVMAFLTDAEKGQASQEDLSQRVRLVRRETDKASLFISQDKADAKAPVPLRASYLAR